MPDFTPAQRDDPAVAGTVVDSLLQHDSTDTRHAFVNFLARSIEWAAQENNDRWGVTLFSNCLCLNVGWVECFVVFKDGINILVEAASSPVELHLNGPNYATAPGCEMTTLAVSDSAQALTALTECHRGAPRPARRLRRGRQDNLLAEHI
ncbi:MAG: hypothetical protein O2968_14350 [Acidobacteria bacterium]|nr:hypothetical protein [Acidobacteriota bacterium]